MNPKRRRSFQLVAPENIFEKSREICKLLVGMSLDEAFDALDFTYDRLEGQSIIVEEDERSTKQPEQTICNQ